MTPTELKERIFLLINLVNKTSYRLMYAKYDLFIMSDDSKDKAVMAEKVNILEAELSALKRLGQLSVFDLMVSGISHREFLKFVEENS